MAVDELRDAIDLIKVGRKTEAREILEPLLIANPKNIQAWVWMVETCENDTEKIRLMEACLVHNPEAGMIKKALSALKAREESAKLQTQQISPFIEESISSEIQVEENPQTTEEAETTEPGQDLSSVSAETIEPKEDTKKRKKWYFRTWAKILMLILCLPLWCVIELGDPDSRRWVKILSGVLVAFFINILCFFLYWLVTTNPSRANLLNWYQYLTGQTASIAAEDIIRVDGTVQNPGAFSFSLIEIQARVYDKDGNLLGNNTTYLDSASILPGSPTRFQLDVTSLDSSLNGGLANMQVLLYDDFSDTGSGWTNSESEAGETAYYQGQYRISVDNANYDLWANPGVNFSDVKIEVDATKLAGAESNRFGIQCRYVDVDNYYFAVISSDGYYGIGKVIDGTQTFLNEYGMLVTDKVYSGSSLNHIRLDCVGSRLTLYVNGDYVDAVDDSDLASGDVGLIAGTFENKGTIVSFDNFAAVNP